MPKAPHIAPRFVPISGSAPEAGSPSTLPEAGVEYAALLSTLMATGASLDDGIKTIAGLGAGTGETVAAVLDTHTERSPALMDALASFLWASPAPAEAVPVLAEHGVSPIRILASPVFGERNGPLATLALALTGDMSLARAAELHGSRVVFRHPAGIGFGAPHVVDGHVSLIANEDGSVWTPRDLACSGGLRLSDSLRLVTRLDRSLDALRSVGKGRGNILDLTDGKALERLPDILEIGIQGILDLHGCAKLTRLPERLKVGTGGTLRLEGCSAWDGELPKGAEFGKNVTVVLPDGRAVPADTLIQARDGKGTGVPKGKAALARLAASMGKGPVPGGVPAALANLEAAGADRGFLVEILREWLDRDAKYWSPMGRLEGAFTWAPGLAADAVPTMTHVLPDGDFQIRADGSAAWGGTGQSGGRDPFAPVRAHLVALPESFRPSCLTLEGMDSLGSLPEGLRLRLLALRNFEKGPSALALRGCRALRSLPKDLETQGLEVTNCASWDRVIPEGVKVRGLIITDGHPAPGISLMRWRHDYGFGPGQ